MRKILFKAKRIDTEEWVQGQYVIFTNPVAVDGLPVEHYIGDGTIFFTDKIDPETLCQFTGKCDKDETMIFEHDIITIEQEGFFCHKGNAEVLYFEESSAYYIEFCDGSEYPLSNFYGHVIKVIGNVFDNQDLLRNYEVKK